MWSSMHEDSGITPKEYDQDHAITSSSSDSILELLTMEEKENYIREKLQMITRIFGRWSS